MRAVQTLPSGMFGKHAHSLSVSLSVFRVLVSRGLTFLSPVFIRRVVYNHQVFQSLDDFKNAWQNGSIKKGTKINLDDDKWATRQRQGEILIFYAPRFVKEILRTCFPGSLSIRVYACPAITGEQRPLDDRTAPEIASFDGSRIRADREEGYVEWMDWSFYTGFNR